MTLSEARNYLTTKGYISLLNLDHGDNAYRYFRHPHYGTIADICQWDGVAEISYRMGTYENLFVLFLQDYLRRENGWEWAEQKAEERARALALPKISQADHAAA